MNCKNYILLAVILLVLVTLTGCGEYSRTQSAQRRWDRVMEQARIDAALESIGQGRLQYAIRVLEDLVESGSAFSDQAEETLKELRTATQRVAAARSADTVINDRTTLN